MQQDGSLCAQHCLNSLLQGARDWLIALPIMTICSLTGPYFTPIDLANFAQELDDAERERMAEGDTTSAEYLRFLQVFINTEQITYVEP